MSRREKVDCEVVELADGVVARVRIPAGRPLTEHDKQSLQNFAAFLLAHQDGPLSGEELEVFHPDLP